MSSKLMDDTLVLAKNNYGKDAEVLMKHENGRSQYWVKHPGREVIASTTLRDLHDSLARKTAPHNNGSGDLLDVKAVAAILGISPNSVSSLIRFRGLKVAERVRGRGGLKPRFRLSDVDDWRKEHTIRQRGRRGPVRQPRAPFPVKEKGSVPSGVRGGAQINATIGTKTRQRMAAFINRYQKPPFCMTLNDFVDSAILHELDRLKGSA